MKYAIKNTNLIQKPRGFIVNSRNIRFRYSEFIRKNTLLRPEPSSREEENSPLATYENRKLEQRIQGNLIQYDSSAISEKKNLSSVNIRTAEVKHAKEKE